MSSEHGRGGLSRIEGLDREWSAEEEMGEEGEEGPFATEAASEWELDWQCSLCQRRTLVWKERTRGREDQRPA